MNTLVLTSEGIDLAASLLKRGELVAFPTETVYGLGAPISNEGSIAKIFSVKGRPQDNPLIVHISSIEQLNDLVAEVPEMAAWLSRAFWPGALTMILKRKASVPAGVSAGLETIAVRMPNHPLARALIEKLGEPIAAPSANLSGKPSSTSAQHVLEDFQDKIAAVLDGGVCEEGIESTVISLVSDRPVLLRPGAITREEIEKVLGLKIDIHVPKRGEKPLSPGMAHRHYAPKAPIKFFQSEKELIGLPLKKRMILSTQRLQGDNTYLLTHQTLYALLRKSDREGVEEILVHRDEALLKDIALMNRLLHAASVN